MANSAYMQRRARYLVGGGRPQAMLWSDNVGTLDNGVYVPNGYEGTDFIIVSDHNRSDIAMTQTRIETRQRMINANMRSYHVADKLAISASWTRLPSRPYSKEITFDPSTGDIQQSQPYTSYTVDGAAGGVDMLSWYESHPGPFYLYLSYDKYRINNVENYNRTSIYNQVLKVYFSAFTYNIEKRSNGGFDFWNVSIALEEV